MNRVRLRRGILDIIPTLTSFSLTGNAIVTAGDTYNLTVTKLLADGSTDTGYLGTISFSSSDASATLPGDYTFLPGDNGSKSFSITFETSGGQSVDVADTSNSSIRGRKSGISVAPDAIDHLVVSGFADPVSAIAGSQNFTVTAKDQFNNTKTDYTGTVTITSSDASATLPAPYTFLLGDSGVKTLSASLWTPGEQSITATDGGANGSQSGITVQAYDTLSLSYPNGTTNYAAFAYSNKLDFNWDDPLSVVARVKGIANTFTVTAGENIIDFEDDAGVHAATVAAATYRSIGDLMDAVKAAWDAASPSHHLTWIWDESDGHITLKSPTSTLFSIFWNTGANQPQEITSLIGFSQANSTGASGETGYEATSSGLQAGLSEAAIVSNIDGNNIVGGYAVVLQVASPLYAKVRLALYIVEDYNANEAILIESTEEFDAENFYSYAVTSDGSGTAAGVTFYVDEVALTPNVVSDTLTGGSTQTNNPVWVGAFAGTNNYLKGFLDELAIFDAELTPTDISNTSTPAGLVRNYNAHAKAANLVTWIRPEPGDTGGVVPDQSDVGNNLDLTLFNGVVTDSEVPT